MTRKTTKYILLSSLVILITGTVTTSNQPLTLIQSADASHDAYFHIDDNGGDCVISDDWDQNTLTCTLMSDIFSPIRFDSDGITLDGNGYTLTSDLAYGVYIPERQNTTLKNLIIVTTGLPSYGILLIDSTSNVILDNTLHPNHLGIKLSNSDSNKLDGNTVLGNQLSVGITIENSDNNNIFGNSASGHYSYGIKVLDSEDNRLKQNTAEFNIYDGINIENSPYTVLRENTARFNGGDGISVETPVKVIDNDSSDNGGYGIYAIYDGLGNPGKSSGNVCNDNSQGTSNFPGLC